MKRIYACMHACMHVCVCVCVCVYAFHILNINTRIQPRSWRATLRRCPVGPCAE